MASTWASLKLPAANICCSIGSFAAGAATTSASLRSLVLKEGVIAGSILQSTKCVARRSPLNLLAIWRRLPAGLALTGQDPANSGQWAEPGRLRREPLDGYGVVPKALPLALPL